VKLVEPFYPAEAKVVVLRRMPSARRDTSLQHFGVFVIS
jgi:hypothetical protein